MGILFVVLALCIGANNGLHYLSVPHSHNHTHTHTYTHTHTHTHRSDEFKAKLVAFMSRVHGGKYGINPIRMLSHSRSPSVASKTT